VHNGIIENFQELKDERCMPPVLQAMFENVGLLADEEADDEK